MLCPHNQDDCYNGVAVAALSCAKLAAGNLKSLIGYDEAELDDTGNIELRWASASQM